MGFFAAIFVISILAFFYAWFLIILFTKRLNSISPESKQKFSLLMSILGAGSPTSSQDMRLISFIRKNEHKRFNDKKLNKLGRSIVRLYYPSLIVWVINLFAMAIYYKIFGES